MIHHVDFFRSSHALVVDDDGNGDPNDEGARWLPGEVFRDPATGIEIRFGGSAGAIEVATSNGNLDYFIGDALPGLFRGPRAGDPPAGRD